MSQSPNQTYRFHEWAEAPLEARRNELDISFMLCWNTNPSGNGFMASHDLCVDPMVSKIWCEACGKHYHVGASNYSTMYEIDTLYVCVKSGMRYDVVEDVDGVNSRYYELGHVYWFPAGAAAVNAHQDSAAFVSLDFKYKGSRDSRFAEAPLASWVQDIFRARFEEDASDAEDEANHQARMEEWRDDASDDE